jgi:NAD(P)-dependent dehydrogenase (short-subunit alcohol dehydrogenase family)
VSTADIAVNKAATILWGVIYGTKAFLLMMLAQRDGCIVNISSVFGLVGFPTQARTT